MAHFFLFTFFHFQTVWGPRTHQPTTTTNQAQKRETSEICVPLRQKKHRSLFTSSLLDFKQTTRKAGTPCLISPSSETEIKYLEREKSVLLSIQTKTRGKERQNPTFPLLLCLNISPKGP